MSSTRTHRRRIGELLVEEGAITAPQLREALATQAQSAGLLGLILMDMGLVSESDIARITCVQLQLPFMSLSNYEMDTKLVDLFEREFLHQHQLLPFDKVGKTVLILVTEIPTEAVLTTIPQQCGLNAGLYVGFISDVKKQLDALVPLSEEQKARQLAQTKKQAPKQAAKQAAKRAAQPQGAEDEVQDGGLIFSGDSKSLLDELDSTWDSIFQNLEDDSAG